jgi:hypothetical protein
MSPTQNFLLSNTSTGITVGTFLKIGLSSFCQYNNFDVVQVLLIF